MWLIMSSLPRDLSDAQWARLDSWIPEPQGRKEGRGRPWRGRREALNGILNILCNGAAWADFPDRYPPYQTCHRRFQQWMRSGIMRGILEAVAEELRLCGGFQLEETFIDGSFAPAKKGQRRRQNQTRKGNKNHRGRGQQRFAGGYLDGIRHTA
jgi:transposase